MTLKPTGVLLTAAFAVQASLIPQLAFADSNNGASSITTNTNGMQVALDNCPPKKRGFHRAAAPVSTKTWSTTNTSHSSSCTTENVPCQQQPVQTITQPAVVQSCPQPVIEQVVPQPAVVAETRSYWPWILGALLVAGVATAIAVPIATHHHHHHNTVNPYYQAVLFTRATP